jgi:integrase
MSVEIRERDLEKGKVSLYLDIYADGKRTYQFLKLYPLKSPKTTKDRAERNEIYRKADAMRIKVESDLLNQNDIDKGFKKSQLLFLDYFKALTEQRKRSKGNYGGWDSTHKILMQFYKGKKIRLADLSEDNLVAIKSYISNDYKTKSNENLSANAAVAYFNKVKACLNQAFDEKLIPDRIGSRVKGLKGEETRREYLTEEEIAAAEKTECEMPRLKDAFLFSVYTGLRWSDIENLQWKNVQYSAETGYSLNFRQQKTQGIEYLPIPNKAIKFTGERKEENERVFKGVQYNAWNNLKIREWMIDAGINKKITFHCARHTFATLLLTKGIDIYTVSKMLGHRNLKTTQVYTKVIDQKKLDAVKIFDELN